MDDIEDKNLEDIPEIKKYFMRIYTVLSKEIREKLRVLDLDKDNKRKVKKELAFLPKNKQIEYLEELIKNSSFKEDLKYN